MKHRILWAVGPAALLALTGCASVQLMPAEKPATPSAMVFDSASGGGGEGGAFFVLDRVDGDTVKFNSADASRGASAGRGGTMILMPVGRYVPAGTHKLSLRARQLFAAPIQTLFMSNASYEVHGDIDVELRADINYRVMGNLDAYRREIWLEEEGSGVVIGSKLGVIDPPLAIRNDPPGTTYACCNLRYEGDWISNASFGQLPFVPAGARVKVLKVGWKSVDVDIEGRPMRLGLDYARDKGSAEALARQFVVTENPRKQILGFAPDVQAAILAGRVLPGMTRAQAMMALGRPPPDKNASLDDKQWNYRTINGEPFVVTWSPDGTLAAVSGKPAVVQQVLHSPPDAK